jgi:uncharacterized protein YggL (DUF469 family)
MTVTGKFKVTIKDVQELGFDLDDDFFIEVSGESIQAINEEVDRVVEEFANSNPDIDVGDEYKIKKFIK